MDAAFGVVERSVSPAGGSARVRIDPGSRWFEGHFPSEPVLPGIAHLAIGAACGAFGEMAVRAIRGARMRAPIGPADEVDVAWTLPGDGRAMKLTLGRGGRPVSAFDLALARGSTEARASGVTIAPAASRATSDLDALLPHRGLARLLVDVVAADETRLQARAMVPIDHPLAWCGEAASYLAVEVAAQAAGAHGGRVESSRDEHGAAPLGFLVGVRDVALPGAALRCGALLHVSVETAGSAPPLRVYRFTVSESQAAVASGELSVYLAE